MSLPLSGPDYLLGACAIEAERQSPNIKRYLDAFSAMLSAGMMGDAFQEAQIKPVERTSALLWKTCGFMALEMQDAPTLNNLIVRLSSLTARVHGIIF